MFKSPTYVGRWLLRLYYRLCADLDNLAAAVTQPSTYFVRADATTVSLTRTAQKCTTTTIVLPVATTLSLSMFLPATPTRMPHVPGPYQFTAHGKTRQLMIPASSRGHCGSGWRCICHEEGPEKSGISPGSVIHTKKYEVCADQITRLGL